MSLHISLLSDQAVYFHESYLHPLNSLLGKKIRIHVSAHRKCLGCSVNTTSPKGYCYRCFHSLARCDLCFLAPYKCHFHQGTCREPQWALETCWSEHWIYLAFSPNPKIGLTRLTQKPRRWLDQGADWAVALAKCSSRKDAGLLEKAMFDRGWSGQGKWRNLLKGLKEEQGREELWASAQKTLKDVAENMSILIEPSEHDPTKITYPVLSYLKPENFAMISSEIESIEDECIGLIGSYMLFKTLGAFGFKRYEGKRIVIEEC